MRQPPDHGRDRLEPRAHNFGRLDAALPYTGSVRPGRTISDPNLLHFRLPGAGMRERTPRNESAEWLVSLSPRTLKKQGAQQEGFGERGKRIFKSPSPPPTGTKPQANQSLGFSLWIAIRNDSRLGVDIFQTERQPPNSSHAQTAAHAPAWMRFPLAGTEIAGRPSVTAQEGGFPAHASGRCAILRA